MSKRDWRETDEDVENVEAWVEIVYDLLDLVPEDHRAEVLAACSKKEEADREERERTGPGFSVMKLDENWRDGPGVRHWNAIERLKSLIVQVFVRQIRNNHHPRDAADILFVEHPHGDGSGSLGDYLDDLPRSRR